ncbi:MAG: diaminopimelate decarboxylase [Pseudomonadota bacterium]|nr:diaminopimelate decarboxylase [Pseudomonadota bacterium]
MQPFYYRNGALYVEGLALTAIAEEFGTPCYVYSRGGIEGAWRAFDGAFGSHPHLVCYAVKANGNLAVLNLLARLGSGFDIVSGGELERVLSAGGDPGKIVFSGVGKRADEMLHALEVGIHCFNIESLPELRRLDQIASRIDVRAPVAIRVNPDVDAKTHPYIATGTKASKFGIPARDAEAVYAEAIDLAYIDVRGIAVHIGSQLTRLDPVLEALDQVLGLVARLDAQGIALRHIDIGGGLGIRYREESPPTPAAYAKAILTRLGGTPLSVITEPGRAVVGPNGVLLTRVEYLKDVEQRHFAIVDAAMNDLVRPALYDAWHDIVPVERSPGPERRYEIAGPVCESGDLLGSGRALNLAPGDVLAVCAAGAYGSSMSSTYNTRPRAAEVLADGERIHLVRRRGTVQDLMSGEVIPPA